MIEGVKVKQLRIIPDERGFLMEILRSDWEVFEKFGQVYITACYPGIVKGWHYHKFQTDHFACIHGMAKVVLYDGREGSSTRGEINEFFVGEKNPLLLKIPPGIIHGFKAIGRRTAIMLNCPTELYNYNNPDEYRLPYDTEEIPYDWNLKHG